MRPANESPWSLHGSESPSFTPPILLFVLQLSTMHKALSTFLDNKISLELPLKYPEVYCITYTPEFPGPLVSTIALLFLIVSSIFTFHAFQTIEIQPSTASELWNTTAEHSLKSPSGMLVPTSLVFIYLFFGCRSFSHSQQ